MKKSKPSTRNTAKKLLASDRSAKEKSQDTEFERQLVIAEEFMNRYHNVLKALADK